MTFDGFSTPSVSLSRTGASRGRMARSFKTDTRKICQTANEPLWREFGGKLSSRIRESALLTRPVLIPRLLSASTARLRVTSTRYSTLQKRRTDGWEQYHRKAYNLPSKKNGAADLGQSLGGQVQGLEVAFKISHAKITHIISTLGIDACPERGSLDNVKPPGFYTMFINGSLPLYVLQCCFHQHA